MLNKAFSFDQDLAEAHATQGLLHMNHGEPQAALEHLDLAIQGNPSEGILYAWRSICLDQLGRHNESNQALEQAFTVDPLHQTIRHNLAVTEAFEGNYALARELVTPDSELAYEVDSVIASREGRFADASLAIIEAMARTEGGYDIRGGSTAAITYFFTLANTEKAREHAIGTFQLLIDTFSVPELAYQKLNSIPASERSLFSQDLLATSLIRLQRCPEMLALYEDFNPLTAPVWGDLNAGYSNVDRMAAYGWCLRQTDREAEAGQLAQRLTDYIAQAVANGQGPTYFKTQAHVQILLGAQSDAIGSLKLAWQQYLLDWTDFESPSLLELQEYEEFQALREAVYAHTNAERAKLGWDPIIWDSVEL